MRIVVDVKSFYDWAPVPADVQVTPKDIAAGRVKPDARGVSHLMRVTRRIASQTTVLPSEGQIIRRVIHHLMPNQGGVALSRKEALADHVNQVMVEQASPKHMTSFTVEDDGPDEKLLREMLEPYTTALHDRSGDPLVDPARIAEIVAKYLEPAKADDHVDHLHAKFGVAKRAVSQ